MASLASPRLPAVKSASARAAPIRHDRRSPRAAVNSGSGRLKPLGHGRSLAQQKMCAQPRRSLAASRHLPPERTLTSTCRAQGVWEARLAAAALAKGARNSPALAAPFATGSGSRGLTLSPGAVYRPFGASRRSKR